ncbi:MAG: DUF2807 domain-containing protein [Dehalococcoidia bacterium]|nr:DUF2807 domain-containing protein [Dehalococcoidia bacterium]
MRRLLMSISAFALTALCLFQAACLSGSGHTVERYFDYADFTSISSSEAFKLEVRHAATYSVTITVDDNLEEYLDVSKDGDKLRIAMKIGYIYSSPNLKAVVTTPRLEGLTVSGAGECLLSGFQLADDFRLEVSGASKVFFSDMSVNRLTLEVSGASKAEGSINTSGDTAIKVTGASSLRLSGRGVDANIEASGASTADMADFSLRDASVNISGASTVKVSAAGGISGEISGVSNLYYTGNPFMDNLDITGVSSVKRIDPAPSTGSNTH